MKSVLMLSSIILVCFYGEAYCQKDFPDWVPKEAVEAALSHWAYKIKIFEPEWLEHQYGFRDKEEASSIELRYPFRIVKVDHENYKEGDDILSHFNMSEGYYNNAFGFAVFYKGSRIGITKVCFINDRWEYFGGSSCGGECDDVLKPIYSKYLLSEGYKIFRNYNESFYVIKDNTVLEAFEYSRRKRTFVGLNPVEHMLKEKKRIEEWKKSPEYKRILKLQKEREREESKQDQMK